MRSTTTSAQQFFAKVLRAWLLLIGLSLCWASYSGLQEALDSARAEVLAYHNSVDLFRNWVSDQHRVYVPASEHTPPNPYLDQIQGRDQSTLTGIDLTMVNPAYVTRQLQPYFNEHLDINLRLTSLKLVNPNNAPDPWELETLQGFELGQPARSELSFIDGTLYMRLLVPLLVQPSCLSCHSKMGYKVGDIRGGLSTSVPVNKHLLSTSTYIATLFFANLVIWIAGVVAIRFARRSFFNYQHELEQSLKEIEINEERSDRAQEIALIGNWEWNVATGELFWSDGNYRIFGVKKTKDPLIETTYNSRSRHH